MLRQAGIEVSEYVMLGIGGRERSREHVAATSTAINAIQPDFLRLRTFVPKINTPLLAEVLDGRFQMLSPHEVIRETMALLADITVATEVRSDHYTNYVNVEGRLPEDKEAMLRVLDAALQRPESDFRPFFIGQAIISSLHSPSCLTSFIFTRYIVSYYVNKDMHWRTDGEG